MTKLKVNQVYDSDNCLIIITEISDSDVFYKVKSKYNNESYITERTINQFKCYIKSGEITLMYYDTPLWRVLNEVEE